METSSPEANFAFKSSVLEAIKHARETYKVVEQALYEIGDIPKVITNLQIYEKIFLFPRNQELFKREFIDFYDQHCGEILASLHNDAWLKEGFKVNAARGLDDPKITRKYSKTAVFDLGKIYRRYCQFEEENTLLYETKRDRPSLQFLTLTLKIFYNLIPDPDQKKEMELVIKTLEQKRGTYLQPQSSNTNGGVSRMFKTIQGLLSRAGFPISDEVLPSEETFNETIESLVNNDFAQGILGKVVNTIKENVEEGGTRDPRQIGEIVTNLINEFTNPEMEEKAKEAMEITSPE